MTKTIRLFQQSILYILILSFGIVSNSVFGNDYHSGHLSNTCLSKFQFLKEGNNLIYKESLLFDFNFENSEDESRNEDIKSKGSDESCFLADNTAHYIKAIFKINADFKSRFSSSCFSSNSLPLYILFHSWKSYLS